MAGNQGRLGRTASKVCKMGLSDFFMFSMGVSTVIFFYVIKIIFLEGEPGKEAQGVKI